MLDIHPPDQPAPPYPLWLYEAVHLGNDGDVQHYAGHCAGAGTVLEIGCGTGRIGRAVAAAGAAVTGIDLSPDAVRAASDNGMHAIEADMRAFDLGQRFDRVIAPYNVLYCSLTEDDFIATLTCMRRHLHPQGELLFDVYCPDALLIGFDLLHENPASAPWVEIEEEPIMRVEAGSRRWDVFEDSYWWPHQQRIDAYFRHVCLDADETIVANIPQRYIMSGELAALLGAAGLTMVGWDGDFDGSAFGPESELMVVRAIASV